MQPHSPAPRRRITAANLLRQALAETGFTEKDNTLEARRAFTLALDHRAFRENLWDSSKRWTRAQCRVIFQDRYYTLREIAQIAAMWANGTRGPVLRRSRRQYLIDNRYIHTGRTEVIDGVRVPVLEDARHG